MPSNRCCMWTYERNVCRRSVARDDRCIFHLDKKTKDEAAQFDRAFSEEFERLEKAKDPVIDLRGFVFPGNLNMKGRIFKKRLWLQGATFLGHAQFADATFLDGAYFFDATFSENAGFRGATFSGAAIFGGAIISGHAGFHDVKFGGYTNFKEATFRGWAGFDGAKFLGDADFDYATFSDDVLFDGARFGRVVFRETKFHGNLRIGAHFDGHAVFERALFQRDTIESSDLSFLLERDPDQDLSLTSFSGATVSASGEVLFVQPREYNARLKVERNLAIDRVSLLNASLGRFNFQDVEWGRYRRWRVVVEEVLMGRPPFEDVTPEQVRQSCARLRGNMERAFRYADAGDFFIGEMNMRRRSLRDKGWRAFPERLLLWLFSWLSRYGESISRPTLAAFILIFSLAGLRLVLHEASEWQFCQPLSFQESLTRSVASFFQLRSTALWTDTLERLVSIPILGVLFIALKRKLERRS